MEALVTYLEFVPEREQQPRRLVIPRPDAGALSRLKGIMSYVHIVERLQNGEEVTLRPSGQSMTPRIKSKQEITIVPIDRIQVGDVVLSKVAGKYFIHLITAIDGDRIQISNNHGHVNGWTNKSKVYGRVKDV